MEIGDALKEKCNMQLPTQTPRPTVTLNTKVARNKAAKQVKKFVKNKKAPVLNPES